MKAEKMKNVGGIICTFICSYILSTGVVEVRGDTDVVDVEEAAVPMDHVDSVIGSGWVYVRHTIPINICPYSQDAYNCTEYQQNIWNDALPAFAPRNPQKVVDPKLFVFLPGTKSTAKDSYFKGVLSSLADLDNVHVIGLNYLSTPFPVSRANEFCGTDGGCVDALHESVVFGSRASKVWNVPKQFSINELLRLAVNSLSNLHPAAGWGSFLERPNRAELDYSKIIIGGHSQGAGHAAYLAAKRSVNRLLLLSGMQDCCSSNSFVGRAWATPIQRTSGVYHELEEAADTIEENYRKMGIAQVGYFENNGELMLDSEGQYYNIYCSRIAPPADCSCSRTYHCSTAVDSCLPLNTSSPSGFSYTSLWQYIAKPM
jgi:hypothetical protein